MCVCIYMFSEHCVSNYPYTHNKITNKFNNIKEVCWRLTNDRDIAAIALCLLLLCPAEIAYIHGSNIYLIIML